MTELHLQYVGFWRRALASVIDSALFFIPLALMGFLYSKLPPWGSDLMQLAMPVLLQVVVPAIAVVCFWVYMLATPGKMLVSAVVVDAQSGRAISPKQAVIRYLGTILALLPLGAGIIWVAFDPKKQGWHDKLAGTVVVEASPTGKSIQA